MAESSIVSAIMEFPLSSILLLVIMFLWIMLFVLKSGQNPRNFPPGPTPLPFIGNLHLMYGRKAERVYHDLAKKYGDIFSLKLGPTVRVVVLNSYDVLKEALLKEGSVFSGRPTPIATRPVYPPNSGVLMSEGDVWKSNRRFSLRHLRDLGLGKTSFEGDIRTEIDIFLAALREKSGKSFNIHTLLGNAVSNVICFLIFGKRYEYDNEEFKKMVKMIDENVETPMILVFLKFIRYIPGFRGYFKKRNDNGFKLKSIIVRHLEEHKAKVDGHCSGENLVDIYLQGKEGALDIKKTVDETIFEDDHMVKTIFDFFVAGTETTTTTLRWALLYMVTHPVVQDKVRAEIDRVIGTGRKPTLNDKNELHYTQAVMAEVQRLGNVVYMSLPHKTTRDVEFRGYTIPVGTTIIPNLVSVHMNEQDFPNPTEFRPERFLDSEQNFDKSMAEKIIPFGIGKRLCLGESLAKMELFLFFTSMMQQFRFKLPDGAPEPSFEGSAGLINSPKPFELCTVVD